jgi:hypothetical protein
MNYDKATYIDVWNRLTDIATVDDDSTLPDCLDSELPDTFQGDTYLYFDNEEDALKTGFITQKDLNNGVTFSTVYRRFLKKQNQVSLTFTVPKDKETAVREAVKAVLHVA